MFKITSRWPHQDSVHVEWNLGKRCNLDCSYCPSEIHDNFSPHTPIAILENTVDKLVKLNKPIRISLTGGEPCVHPDIEVLLDYLKLREISWVNVTTNGTRSSMWYLENEVYWNHLVFSLHFENDWKRILHTIQQYHDSTEREFFVNVMAHHQHMNDVRNVAAKLTSVGIKYALRRIRWTEGNHDIFDDMRYDGRDLEWLLSKEATAQPNVLVDDEQLYHANDIIKENRNQFLGWKCSAGIESLMINWDGDVHRATCRVGGSLGNIYEGSFEVPSNPIICTRTSCTCAADIPLTKVNEQAQEIS
jgi:MoaA/NifB/PqqE/SkfB family radical SAM enzyme